MNKTKGFLKLLPCILLVWIASVATVQATGALDSVDVVFSPSFTPAYAAGSGDTDVQIFSIDLSTTGTATIDQLGFRVQGNYNDIASFTLRSVVSSSTYSGFVSEDNEGGWVSFGGMNETLSTSAGTFILEANVVSLPMGGPLEINFTPMYGLTSSPMFQGLEPTADEDRIVTVNILGGGPGGGAVTVEASTSFSSTYQLAPGDTNIDVLSLTLTTSGSSVLINEISVYLDDEMGDLTDLTNIRLVSSNNLSGYSPIETGISPKLTFLMSGETISSTQPGTFVLKVDVLSNPVGGHLNFVVNPRADVFTDMGPASGKPVIATVRLPFGASFDGGIQEVDLGYKYNAGSGYTFRIGLEGRNINSVSVGTPNQVSFSLIQSSTESGDDDWELKVSYTDFLSMTADFPAGSYTFTVNASETFILDFSGSDFTEVPSVLSPQDAELGVSRTPLVSWTGVSTGDFIFIEIEPTSSNGGGAGVLLPLSETDWLAFKELSGGTSYSLYIENMLLHSSGFGLTNNLDSFKFSTFSIANSPDVIFETEGGTGMGTNFLTSRLSSDKETSIITPQIGGYFALKFSDLEDQVDFSATLPFEIAPSGVSAVHIHEGAAGVDGPVVLDLLLPGTSFGSIIPTNTILHTTNILSSTIASAILANPENYYVNIHTSTETSGHIRGQLKPWKIAPIALHLNGAEETIVVDAFAGGFADLSFKTPLSMEYYISMNDPSIFDITQAHIQVGMAGEDGPSLLNLETANATINAFQNMNHTIPTMLSDFTAIWNDPMDFYLSVKTSATPAGIVRGQLRENAGLREIFMETAFLGKEGKYTLFMDVTTDLSVTSVSVKPMAGASTTSYGLMKVGDAEWSFDGQRFNDVASLTAFYGSGDYVFTINGIEQTTVNFSPIGFNNVPMITFPTSGAGSIFVKPTFSWTVSSTSGGDFLSVFLDGLDTGEFYDESFSVVSGSWVAPSTLAGSSNYQFEVLNQVIQTSGLGQLTEGDRYKITEISSASDLVNFQTGAGANTSDMGLIAIWIETAFLSNSSMYTLFVDVDADPSINSISVKPAGVTTSYGLVKSFNEWTFDGDKFSTFANLEAFYGSGDYVFTIDGINGIDQTTVSFFPVDLNNAPSITSPLDGAIDVDVNSLITWTLNASGGGEVLNVELNSDDGRGSQESSFPVGDGSWTPAPLAESSNYKFDAFNDISLSSGTGSMNGDSYDYFLFSSAIDSVSFMTAGTTPTGPSEPSFLVANISSDNETTEITPTVKGLSAFEYHADTGMLSFAIKLENSLTGTVIQGVHIHQGAAFTDGSVVVDLSSGTLNSATNVISGSIFVSTSVMDPIISFPEGFYLNVHTDAFPSGHLREQLETFRGAKLETDLFGSNEVNVIAPDAEAHMKMDLLSPRKFVYEIFMTTPDSSSVTSVDMHAGPAGADGFLLMSLNPTVISQEGAIVPSTEMGLSLSAFVRLGFRPEGFYVELKDTQGNPFARGQLEHPVNNIVDLVNSTAEVNPNSVDVGVPNVVTIDFHLVVTSSDTGFSSFRIEFPDGMDLELQNLSENGFSLQEFSDFTISTMTFPRVLELQLSTDKGLGTWDYTAIVNTTANSPALGTEVFVGISNSTGQGVHVFDGDANGSPTDSNSLFFESNDNFFSGGVLDFFEAEAEISTGSFIETSSSFGLDLNIFAQVGNGDGFDKMAVIFPIGFSTTSSPIIFKSTSSFFDYTISALPNIDISRGFVINFTTPQGNGDYVLSLGLQAPSFSGAGFVSIFAKNTASGDEMSAFQSDVDGDSEFGSLDLNVYEAQGVGVNVSEATFEVTVTATTNEGGLDIAPVEVGSLNAYRVFVKPNFSAGDAGFDQVSIHLPAGMELLGSEVQVSLKLDGNSVFTNLLNSEVNVDTMDPDFVRLHLVNPLTETSENLAVLRVMFFANAPGFPEFYPFNVQLDKSGNSVPLYPLVGDADGVLNRDDGGFSTFANFSNTMNVDDAVAELITSGEIKTSTSATFSVFVHTTVSGASLGFDLLNLDYPFEFSSISGVAVSSGASTSGLSAISSSEYSLDTNEPGVIRLGFTNIQSGGVYRLTFTAITPGFPMTAFFGVALDHSTNYNPFFANFGNVVSGQGLDRMDIDIAPSFTAEDIKPVVNDGLAELIFFPAAGDSLPETNSMGKMSFVFQTTSDSTNSGFDVIKVFKPFGFFSAPQNVVLRRSTSAGTILLDVNKLGSTDFSVNNNTSLDALVVELSQVQTSTNFSGYVYALSFDIQLPEFSTQGMMDIKLDNKLLPQEFTFRPGNVVNASSIFSGTFLGNNNLDYVVVQPIDPLAEANVLDLVAEVNSTPEFPVAGQQARFVVSVNPVINPGQGIDRIIVDLPFDFGTPSDISVRLSTSPNTSGSTDAGTVQTLLQTEIFENTIIIKLNSADTSTAYHYYDIKFKSIVSDFPGPKPLGVRVNRSTNPGAFDAFEDDANGFALDNNGLLVDVVLDLGGTIDTSPLIGDLIVETNKNSMQTDAVEDVILYVMAAKITSSTQQGFDHLEIFSPYDFGAASAVSVEISTDASSYSALSESFDYTLTKNQNVSIFDFSSVQAQNETKWYRFTLSGVTAQSYPSIAFFDVIVDKKGSSQEIFAIPGDANGTLGDIDFNEISVYPASVDRSSLPLEGFFAEILATSAVTGQNATLSYYLKVDLGTTATGFDSFNMHIPFDFGTPGNFVLSSSSPTSTGFAQLTNVVDYTLNTDDTYNPRIVLSTPFNNLSAPMAVYRIQFNSVSPEFPTFEYFGVSVSDSSNPFEFFPEEGDANGIVGDSDSLNVIVSFDGDVQSSAPTLNDLRAEMAPNDIQVSTDYSGTVSAKATLITGNSGYDRIKLFIPPTFSSASIVSLEVDSSALLKDVDYTVKKVEGGLLISLSTAVSAVGEHNHTLAFKAKSGNFPGDEYFDIAFSKSGNPFQEFALWDEVNANAGDGSMRVTVSPVFIANAKPPLSVLNAELLATNSQTGSSQILAGETAHIEIFFSATSDAGSNGFDQWGVGLPFGFGSPTGVTVKASTIASSTNYMTEFLDYTLDTSEPELLKINFSTTQGTGNFTVGFDVAVSEFPDTFFMEVAVLGTQSPTPFWANFGMDVNGTVGDSDDLVIRVIPNISGVQEANVVDLIAEVNVTPESPVVGSVGVFSVAIEAMIDTGIDRLLIQLPFGFGEPSGIGITRSTISSSGAISGTSDFAAFTSLLRDGVLVIKFSEVDTDTSAHTYTVNFNARVPDFSGIYDVDVAATRSTNPVVFFARPGDVNRIADNDDRTVNVVPDMDLSSLNSGTLDLSDVVDGLLIEASPDEAQSGTTATFSLYVRAKKGAATQKGFDQMEVFLPHGFKTNQLTGVSSSTSNGGSFNSFSPLSEGLGSDYDFNSKFDGNRIILSFSSLQAVTEAKLYKLVFDSQLPSYPTFGYFEAVVENSDEPGAVFAFEGDANATSTDSNSSEIAVYPADLVFDQLPVDDFVAEIVSSSAVVGETASLVYYLEFNRGAGVGFDTLELFIPLEFGQVSNISISSKASGESAFSAMVHLVDYDLDSSNPDLLRVELSSLMTMSGVLKISLEAQSPDAPLPFFFDVALKSSSNPIPVFPDEGDVDGLANQDSLVVSVVPGSGFQADLRPVELLLAELSPNELSVGDLGHFTVMSKIELLASNGGFDQITVFMPPSFGSAENVDLEIPDLVSGRSLVKDLEYTVIAKDGFFAIKLSTALTSNLVTSGVTYTTLSFDAQAGKFPGYEFIDVAVSNSNNPIREFAFWDDMNPDLGNGSLSILVNPAFTTVIRLPVDNLYDEVLVTRKSDGSSTIIVSTSVHIDVFIEATSFSGDVTGFDQIGMFIPYGFGTPSNFTVKLSTIASSTAFLTELRDYTLDLSDPYTPKINLSTLYGASGFTLGFDIETPEFPTQTYVDTFVNNAEFFFPIFGEQNDVNGDVNDGNTREFFVLPDLSQGPRGFSVEHVVAEINSAGEVKAGSTADLVLALRVENNAGEGFDRLGLILPPNFGNPSSTVVLKKNGTTLVVGTDYSVDTNDSSFLKIKLTTIHGAGVSNDTYTLAFKVQAPSFPVTGYFEAGVDNSSLQAPVFAFWNDVDGVENNNGLFIDVVPDRSVFTAAELEKDNLSELFAEVVVFENSVLSKEVEASTQAGVRVYINPVIGTSDRGIHTIEILNPEEFGTPSNVVVYTSVSSSTSRSPMIEFLDYNKTVGENNSILISLTTAITQTSLIEVDFKAKTPSFPGGFYIDVVADNKNFPEALFAEWANLNGDDDDDGDGIEDSFGDNNTIIQVVPRDIGDAFDALSHVSGVQAELVSTAFGEVETSATLALAIHVTMSGSDGGYDQISMRYPKLFSSLSNFSLAYSTTTGGSTQALTELIDYTVSLDNSENVRISFTATQSESRIFYTTLSALLPSGSGSHLIGVSVDNSVNPKKVDAEIGDVLPSVGSDDLVYKVRPRAVVAGAQEITLLSSLSARISPRKVGIDSTTTYSVGIRAIVASTSAGFDTLVLRVPDEFGTPSNVTVSTGASLSAQTRLLNILDYTSQIDEHSIRIRLSTTLTGSLTMRLGFSASSGSTPGETRFKLAVANSAYPMEVIAQTDTSVLDGRAGRMKVVVTPSRRSNIELSVAPVRPVSFMGSEILPVEATVSQLTAFSVYCVAEVDTTTDSGFDQLVVALPESFGTVSNVSLKYLDTTTVAGVYRQFTDVSDYTVEQNSERVLIFKLKSSVAQTYETIGSIKRANFMVGFDALMPALPAEEDVLVSVDNSKNPGRILSATNDVTGDGLASLSVKIEPDLNSFDDTQEVASSLIAEISSQTVYFGETKNLDLYLSASTSSSSLGFDALTIFVPYGLADFSNITLSTLSSSSSASYLLTELVDYDVVVDRGIGKIHFNLAKMSHSSTATTLPVFKVSMEIVAGDFFESGGFGLSVSNSNTGLTMDVTPGDAHSESTPNALGMTVIEDNSTLGTNKVGFFGEIVPTTSIITSFTGVVRAWDGSAFVTDIASSTEASHPMIFFTTPTFSSTDAGFDYLSIDLPSGSGAPSNFVLYLRTSDGGTLQYFEEFYDYQVNLNRTGQIVVQFKDENGDSSPLDASKMGSFDQMVIGFDMPLPKRLGQQFFDLYVDNSSASNRFYIDSEVGNREYNIAVVNRTDSQDGTRFMSINTFNASANSALSNLQAEIESVGENRMPISAVRNMRLDFTSIKSGADTGFNQLEIQFPEGFAGLSQFSIDRGTETLKLYSDYTLDTKHPRNTRINFTTPQDSATYTARFSIRTPAGVEGKQNVTYGFGLLADLVSENVSIVSTTPAFATSADVTTSNAGDSLSVQVGSDRLISGSLNFTKALDYETKVSIELYDVATGLLVDVVDPLSVPLAIGTSTVNFTFSQLTGSLNSGLDDGTYKIKVSLAHYQDTFIGSDSNPVAIIGGASVTGLSVNVDPTDIQASLSFLPASNQEAGTTGTVTIRLEPVLNGLTTSLDSFAFKFVADSGSVGDFSSLDITALRVAGVAQTPDYTQTNGEFTVVTTAFGSSVSGSYIEIDLSVGTSATQSGVFILKTTLVGNASSVVFEAAPKAGLDSADARIVFLVGVGPLAITTGTNIDAILGASFQSTIATVGDVRSGSLNFSQVGLPTDLGVTLNSSGLLSGVPSRTSMTGFPFTVSVEYITTSSDAGVVSKDFNLFIHKLGFDIYSIEPVALPTTGGSIVVKGRGFSSETVVTISGTVVELLFVDSQTLVVTATSLASGLADVVVVDGNDVTRLPNARNPISLTVAEETQSPTPLASSVGEGQATVFDYDIVGLPYFYQESARDLMIAAFGAYDNKRWRVFGYDQGYFELDQIPSGNKTKLSPGTAFWRISRVKGEVQLRGVDPANVSSYTLSLPAESWSLVTNLYSSEVVWADLIIHAGSVDAPVETTVNSTENLYLNQTLWGMDKSSSNEARPYKPESVMKSGLGYWVYNKSRETVILEITRPATEVLTKSNQQTLYKPEESLPPEAPASMQSGSFSSGSGGGCFLR